MRAIRQFLFRNTVLFQFCRFHITGTGKKQRLLFQCHFGNDLIKVHAIILSFRRSDR